MIVFASCFHFQLLSEISGVSKEMVNVDFRTNDFLLKRVSEVFQI